MLALSRSMFHGKQSVFSAEQRSQCQTYAQLLIRVAKTHGLIGFGASEVEAHLCRALLLLDLDEVSHAASIVDVGSGAGLPGIPIAIAVAQTKELCFVEPKRRAVAFLEMALRELDLLAKVWPTTAEQLFKSGLSDPADVVLARALAKPRMAARVCAPLARVGGAVLITGSPDDLEVDWGEDLDETGLGEPRTLTLSGPLDITQKVHIIPKVRVAES